MPKTTGPMLSLDASGSIGKALTFQRKRGANILFSHHQPGSRAPYVVTPGHQSQENRIGYIVARWQSLTPAQKTQWDEDAKNAGIVGAGYHYFMKTHGGKTSPWPNGFLHRKKITIDHTKVSGAQVNFPLLVSLVDADLEGCQSSGNDILFTSSDGITKLDHEIERFVVASGTLIAWVRIPSLSASVNTEIYMYYEQPLAVNQQNPTGVWDSNYVAVWHMKDATVSTIVDSKGTNTGTKGAANQPIEADGKIGKGQSFNGTSDRILLASPAALDNLPNNNFSIEAVVKDLHTAINIWGTIFGVYLSGVGWACRTVSDATGCRRFYVDFPCVTTVATYASLFGSIPVNQYCHVTFEWTAFTKSGKIRINGVEGSYSVSTAGVGDYKSDAALNKELGRLPHAGGIQWFKGIIDETRIASIIRPAGWPLTSSNNQLSPSTFFSVGGEE